MQYILKFSILAFLLLALTNCSLDDGYSDYGNYYTYQDQNSAQKAFDNIKIVCENKNDCPDSVGGMIYLETSYENYSTYIKLGSCSQTLIGSNRVVMNRHCLPSGSKYKGATCGNIKFIFPETKNSPAEEVKCKSVIDLSSKYDEDNPMVPDWTVLELNRSLSRAHAIVDTSGIPHQSSLQIYPIKFEKNNSNYSPELPIKGIVQKKTCRSQMNSIFSFFYTHPLSPLVTMICDRNVIMGNSGSGVFNIKGHLSAVVSMTIKENHITKVSFMGKKHRINTYFAGGTNAQCISTFNPNPSKACYYNESDTNYRSVGGLLNLLYGQYVSPSKSQSFEYVINKNPNVKWEAHNSNTTATVFSSAMYNLLSKALGNSVAGFSNQFEQNLRFPKTPKCIMAPESETDKISILKWPFFIMHNQVNLAESSLIHVPLELDTLSFEMRIDSINGLYTGKLLRLPKELSEYFLELTKEINKNFLKCLISDESWNCYKYRQSLKQKETLINSQNYPRYLYSNEEFLSKNALPESTLTLPICE